jgi:hypothetical protein
MTNGQNGEHPADLLLWFADGWCGDFPPRVKADTEVSIGRTDSKRGLGFRIMNKQKKVIDFALDRDQVIELIEYLKLAVPRLRKPLGRKRVQNTVAAELWTVEEDAAYDEAMRRKRRKIAATDSNVGKTQIKTKAVRSERQNGRK